MQMEILRGENAPRRVRFEVWHDTGHGADRRGIDPHFRVTPGGPVAAPPAVPVRAAYGTTNLTKVFAAETTVRAADCDRADFFYRLLNDPHAQEFTYHGNEAARRIGLAYGQTGLRPPRWGDDIVLDWPGEDFGPGARLIHATWPTTDLPRG
jgi:hypothetical protein